MANFDYLDLIGIPFARGGRGPDAYDCYGLLVEMYRRQGIVLPDFVSPGTLEEVAVLISQEEASWKRVEPRTPGSLITFRVESVGAHVGFMLENDTFIHAIDPIGVTVERLTGNVLKPLAFYTYG